MRRFQVKLRDESGIDIGVVLATFIVVAESPAEAEMYVGQYMWPQALPGEQLIDRPRSPWTMANAEIPTAD